MAEAATPPPHPPPPQKATILAHKVTCLCRTTRQLSTGASKLRQANQPYRPHHNYYPGPFQSCVGLEICTQGKSARIRALTHCQAG